MLLVNDRRLLEAFRAGQPEALETVYAHYQPRIAAFLRGGFSFKSGERWMRFRGYSSAYEVAQAVHETMARAFLPRPRLDYDGLRPYGDYLLGIARNYVINELRRNDHLVVVGGESELEPRGDMIEPAPPAAESTLEEREVARLLSTFKEGLSESERRLFDLRFSDELGQDEAAAAMGLSRIQVRRAEYKVKEKLLFYLKKHGYLSRVPKTVLGARLRMVLP